jgi:TATA-binding protein-associated factor
LLLDCGIGNEKDTLSDAVGQHRVLVFAQLKSVLDLVENDLFKRLMPTVTYLRMDGAASSAERFQVWKSPSIIKASLTPLMQIVRRFNEDPTIDVLLLTTHVGGLGLNLTGADTVKFHSLLQILSADCFRR